uniref:Uncharacterized protein n=1 Tax=viral metagenome TaxID=1070528 RepID=A0A6H1ZAR6_9ZZZZ
MIKFPFKTIIAGKEYTIHLDRKDVGACFDSESRKIVVTPVPMIEENLLHEILEAILTERFHRYQAINEDYVFSFDHTQFSNVVKDVVLALKPLLIRLN